MAASVLEVGDQVLWVLFSAAVVVVDLLEPHMSQPETCRLPASVEGLVAQPCLWTSVHWDGASSAEVLCHLVGARGHFQLQPRRCLYPIFQL